MKREEATYKTTNLLVKIARSHFTKDGYHNVSLETIAEEGEVTRGAVYHHFKSKKGLFIAVLESVQKDVAAQIKKEASQHDDPWQQLILGCLGFVKGANAEKNRRILLVDAPVILGWDAWRKADLGSSVSVLKAHIDVLETQGYLQDDVDAQLMTFSISGALNELALIYSASGKSGEEDPFVCTISRLVSGFRR
ncbi:MAG: TetR/AcrR family transcriptional regulator [Oscillospiraceae bacterium]|nr:TetR/AcrR family transcriptional regulator [Oscillospiraceae bacterium]